MTAEPLVLLPGFMCDGRLFWHQMTAFSSERGVMVCPLRGDTIEAMAAAVLAMAPPTFAVAGHWLGGLVALDLLRQAPERITRLALIDVSPLSETPLVAGAREHRIVKARTGKLDEAMLEEVPANALAPGPNKQNIQAMMLDMAAALGPDVFDAQSHALMRRPDLQRALRSTKLYTTLVCGEYDTICPPRRHEFLAELMPNARCTQISGAGHLAPLEQPEAVTEALRTWLRD
ncbi:alpha/beta fold hydrolase [Rhodobacteraceae bacterium]|nr:alpha/beta fold hydrolase [Paracoccaceae bacterium]